MPILSPPPPPPPMQVMVADRELAARIERAAKKAGVSVDVWVTRTLRDSYFYLSR